MGNFSIITPKAIETAFSDPKAGAFAEQSFIFAILTGIRLHLFKALGVKIELSFSDYVKQQWKLNKLAVYPRSYLSLTSFEIQRDRRNSMAVKTLGVSNSLRGANNETGNYLKKAKVFPVKLSMEFHYFDSDMDRTIFFVENLATLIAANSLNFILQIQDKFEHHVRIVFDDSLSIPVLQYSNDTDPNSIEISCNLTVDTFIGIIEDQARAYDLTSPEAMQKPRIHL